MTSFKTRSPMKQKVQLFEDKGLSAKINALPTFRKTWPFHLYTTFIKIYFTQSVLLYYLLLLNRIECNIKKSDN